MTLHDEADSSGVMAIPSIVVDGNPDSRNVLCSILSRDPEIDFLGHFETKREVSNLLQDHSRVLLFIDVQMPGFDCFRLLHQLGPSTWPIVILIASDMQWAMNAFQAHVFGYLLRPVSDGLVRANLQSAKTNFEHFQARGALTSFQAAGSPPPSERLVVKSRGRFTLLRSEEIDWIEAKGNYVRIHAGPMCFTERKTMISLEAKLNPATFARIHKSTIVNLDKIRELRVWPTGEYAVLMRNGKELTLTRRYRERLSTILGRHSSIETPARETPALEEIAWRG